MNEPTDPRHDANPENSEASESKKSQGSRTEGIVMRLFLFVILAAGSLAFFTLVPQLSKVGDASSAEQAHMQEDINNLTHRVQSLETRLDVLNTVTPASSPTSEPTEVKPDLASVANLTQMQNNLASLSSAMTALQTEVKATDATATTARDASQTLVAAVVAYVQLREAANTGHDFANELAQLRDASKNDADLQIAATKLEPYAANGAPTLDALRQQLMDREPAIAVAIAKSEAQNWWQRVMAELKSLVTVRPIHGGANDALTALEITLTKESAAAAMDVFKSLPDEAQKNLADWQKQLEARQHVDEGMAAITAHFTALPPVKNP